MRTASNQGEFRHRRTKKSSCSLGPDRCASNLPTGFGDMFINTFNYSSPEMSFGMQLQINLRNRVPRPRPSFSGGAGIPAESDQLRSRRSSSVSNCATRSSLSNRSRLASLPPQKARDLAAHTFDITRRENWAPSPATDAPCSRHAIWVLPSPPRWPRRQSLKKRRWRSTAPPEYPGAYQRLDRQCKGRRSYACAVESLEGSMSTAAQTISNAAFTREARNPARRTLSKTMASRTPTPGLVSWRQAMLRPSAGE